MAVHDVRNSGMASQRYASYVEEEDWDIATLELVNSHLEKYVKMVRCEGPVAVSFLSCL